MSLKRPRQPGAKKGASGPLSRLTADLALPLVKPVDLPAFDNPPVVEVASSVQFGTIPGLDAVRLGLLWSAYRDDYPRTEQYPPLPHEIESFGAPSPSQVMFSMASMISPRCWFLNGEKGTRMLQVQHDRFVLNWRKLDIDEEQYPHYDEALRPLFVKEYGRFERFLREEGLPTPVPDQADLTYINHIPAGEPKAVRESAARFINLWNEPQGGLLPTEEDVSFACRFIMRDDAGAPMGRLYVNLQAHYKLSTGSPLYVLQLTARGAPQGEGFAGALAFLQRGHEWIVRAFTDITTPEMHRLWKRKQ